MVPSHIWDILRCPVCYCGLEYVAGETPERSAGGESRKSGTRVACVKCGMRFGVQNDVPLMIPPDEQSRLRRAVQGTKENASMSSFSEVTGGDKGKEQLLQGNQYEHKISGWKRLARKLYPPGPVVNFSIGKKLLPLIKKCGDEDRIINVGAGGNRYSEKVINVDLDLLQAVDVVSSGTCLPFAENTFDLAINQAVLEHVLEPREIVAEIYRVLKPGGHVFVEVPFMQEYHSFPVDFQRYTLTGLEHLLRDFEKVESGIAAGPSAAFGRLFREYVASFTSNIYTHQLLKFVFGWLVWPMKFLDYYLVRKKYAHVMAMGFYFVGRKPQ